MAMQLQAVGPMSLRPSLRLPPHTTAHIGSSVTSSLRPAVVACAGRCGAMTVLAAIMVGGARRGRSRRHVDQDLSRRPGATRFATNLEEPDVDETSTDEEDDEEDDDEESSEIQVRPKMELDRMLPEDELRKEWVMPPRRVKGKRTIRPKSMKRVEWDEEDHVRDFGHNPWSSFALAPASEKELVAKSWTRDARSKAAERSAEERARSRVGDDVGTGPSHSAYVEIRERWDGPEEEAVNIIVAEHLNISLEKASRLVELGAVWYYDNFEIRDWVRIMEPQRISVDTVLRVFPNPERYKTCYVDDWDERIKKVDRDFVVVDKPPLLPCFAHVTNGKEVVHRCLADALRVRKVQEVELGMDDTNMTAMTHIDDEVSGLVVLARHEKARIVCQEWVRKEKCVFEFVAICTKNVEKGTYRHFYMKTEVKKGQKTPTLYDEIPSYAINVRSDYYDWDVVSMEVVSTAPLDGGCAAVRIRTKNTGPTRERIRAQLAMLGAPVLNDKAVTRGAEMSKQVAKAAGLLPEPAKRMSDPTVNIVPGLEDEYSATAAAVAATAPLGGAVDDEVLRGPYGHMLELLPEERYNASRGIPQTPRQKVPVALHLARVEFGGRVVTSAPPPYWPEGAAAAVAVQLTEKDIKTSITEYLILQGGWSTIRKVGGRFGVKVDWLEEQFPVIRHASRVFASESALKEWESEMRVKRGRKSVGGFYERRARHKKKMWQLRERYLRPQEWGKKRLPSYKEIKRGLAKPIEDYLGRTNM